MREAPGQRSARQVRSVSRRVTKGRFRALRVMIARLVRRGVTSTNLDRHGWIVVVDRRTRLR